LALQVISNATFTLSEEDLELIFGEDISYYSGYEGGYRGYIEYYSGEYSDYYDSGYEGLYVGYGRKLPSSGSSGYGGIPEPAPPPSRELQSDSTDSLRSFSGGYGGILESAPPPSRKLQSARRSNLLPLLADPTTNFTFFAPTDAAFRAIPLRLKIRLFGGPRLFAAQFENLLLYHCLVGGRRIGDFPSNGEIESLNNEELGFRAGPDGSLRINQIPITDPDEVLANGITQKIGGVFRPRWVTTTIFQVVSEDDDLSLLRRFLRIAELNFNQDQGRVNPRTLLGPSNTAFQALGQAKLDSLLDPDDTTELVRILRYHTIESGALTRDNLQDVDSLKTRLSDDDYVDSAFRVQVLVDGTTIKFNQATVEGDSTLVFNGAFIKIDKVLNPDDPDVGFPEFP
jgi:uncharacterized surface protein with fasciclin (FAS1) repeats